MSAFLVSKAHIDYLITAGLVLPKRLISGSRLRWFLRPPEDQDGEVYREGEPWGPGLATWIERTERTLTYDNADEVGAMLWATNQDSVNHRYAETSIEHAYRFEEVLDIDPVWTLKALDCYEYQACEHPQYLTSEARFFVEALRDTAIGLVDGYRDAPWEITSEDVILSHPSSVPAADREEWQPPWERRSALDREEFLRQLREGT